MPSDEEFTSTTTCVTNIRRTFILTLCLMCVTLTAMYGSTEHFHRNQFSVFQKLQDIRTFKDNVSEVLMNIVSDVRNTTDVIKTNATDLKNNIVTHIATINSMILKPQSGQPETYVTNNHSAVLKNKLTVTTIVNDTRQENGAVGMSKEFPWMPDPCLKPRRKTGVEDILCMQPPKFLPQYKNPCWMDAGVFRCLPYFHLIGICKSGTSDFFKRLLLHPDIVPNKGIFGKEIWYWSWNRFSTKGRGGKFKLGMTLKEFTQQFDTKTIQNGVDHNGNHVKITGHGDPMDIWDRFREEATPQNVPGAEELLWTTPYAIKHINPNVKLILMLRDPVDRLYSHYFHSKMGTSAQTFHAHVVQSIDLWNKCTQQHTVRHCIYSPQMKIQLRAPIYTSFYIVHLREWLKLFPLDQLLIFRNEDFAQNMKETMVTVFKYLKVSIPDDNLLERMKTLPHFYETKSKTAAGPMLPLTKKLLIDLYRPYTEELATYLKDERFAFKDRSFG